MTHPNKPRTIRLKEDMKSCVTQGEKNVHISLKSIRQTSVQPLYTPIVNQ
jgi:hypothetical protein